MNAAIASHVRLQTTHSDHSSLFFAGDGELTKTEFKQAIRQTLKLKASNEQVLCCYSETQTNAPSIDLCATCAGR